MNTSHPKIQTRIINEVDSYDLDEIITNYFKENHGFTGRFEFVPFVECGNDSSHSFNGIDGIINEWEQKELDKVLETKDYYEAQYNAGLFLNYLANKDVIPHGDYLVKVCW